MMVLQSYYQEILTHHPHQLHRLNPGLCSGACVTCPWSCSFGNLSHLTHQHHIPMTWHVWADGQGRGARILHGESSASGDDSPALP